MAQPVRIDPSRSARVKRATLSWPPDMSVFLSVEPSRLAPLRFTPLRSVEGGPITSVRWTPPSTFVRFSWLRSGLKPFCLRRAFHLATPSRNQVRCSGLAMPLLSLAFHN